MINIVSKCFGCTACYTVCPVQAITMEIDERGFAVPIVNEDLCVKCDTCKNVCPAIIESASDSFVPQVYAVKHNQLSVLLNSASGGLFTALSDIVLENGGIIYGAVQDEHLSIIHKRAATREERDMCRAI